MNAHNEQQSLIAGLQDAATGNTTTVRMMALCAAAARVLGAQPAALDAQPSPVVKQNLTTQPAAAPEAVGWQWRWLDTDNTWSEWADGGSRKEIDARIARWKADGEDHRMQVRPVFAAPVTAAPVATIVAAMRNFADVADRCQITEANAGSVIRTWADQLEASTPAAPGIDLRSLLDCWRNRSSRSGAFAASVIDRNIRELEELIDASPKDELESWKRGTKACAEVLGQVMRQTQDSPKGGSEARDSVLAALVEAATAVERADADGELTDDLVDRLRAARDAAQAGDAEVQP